LASKTPNAPDSITLQFLRADGTSIQLRDLGDEFLEANGITSDAADRPFRVLIEKQTSKAGNAFYDYSQNGVTLPDGLRATLAVEGVRLAFGDPRPSKKGYPTREGKADLEIGGVLYEATAYITEAKHPYFVKVHAHKKPDSSKKESKAAPRAPRGGRIA